MSRRWQVPATRHALERAALWVNPIAPAASGFEAADAPCVALPSSTRPVPCVPHPGTPPPREVMTFGPIARRPPARRARLRNSPALTG